MDQVRLLTAIHYFSSEGLNSRNPTSLQLQQLSLHHFHQERSKAQPEILTTASFGQAGVSLHPERKELP